MVDRADRLGGAARRGRDDRSGRDGDDDPPMEAACVGLPDVCYRRRRHSVGLAGSVVRSTRRRIGAGGATANVAGGRGPSGFDVLRRPSEWRKAVRGARPGPVGGATRPPHWVLYAFAVRRDSYGWAQLAESNHSQAGAVGGRIRLPVAVLRSIERIAVADHARCADALQLALGATGVEAARRRACGQHCSRPDERCLGTRPRHRDTRSHRPGHEPPDAADAAAPLSLLRQRRPWTDLDRAPVSLAAGECRRGTSFSDVAARVWRVRQYCRPAPRTRAIKCMCCFDRSEARPD
jgi:hypothetical protein